MLELKACEGNSVDPDEVAYYELPCLDELPHLDLCCLQSQLTDILKVSMCI